MSRAKAIFAMVKRVKGKNKGKTVKRYFKSEAERAKSLKNYARYGKGGYPRTPKEKTYAKAKAGVSKLIGEFKIPTGVAPDTAKGMLGWLGDAKRALKYGNVKLSKQIMTNLRKKVRDIGR